MRWDFHRPKPNSPHSRAEQCALKAFGIAAAVIGVMHFLAHAIDTLAPNAPNPMTWPTIMTVLPSMPLYILAISPWDLPDPISSVCSTILSALVWGLLAAMPTYIYISRSDDASQEQKPGWRRPFPPSSGAST